MRIPLEMAYRAPIESLETVCLPMSRYDIADYLAIAVETVSRSLTTLRSKRVIAFLRHAAFPNPRSEGARGSVLSLNDWSGFEPSGS